MSSSKRSQSPSPQASKSRSHHRSKRSRSGGKHREEHSKDNSTSSIVLRQILEKITQLSSHVEKIDGRLDLLESTRTDQAELQNSQLPLEREAPVCHPAFEEERFEYFDRLSVRASPDHILDDSSPNVDNHDGHRVAPMTSKSLDPVQNVNGDEASMPQSQHGEQSRLEDGISEKPRLYNPTAESPGWAPSDSFKEFLNSSFRRNLSSSQVFKVLEKTALPDMDIFVTPKLDKSLADQISPHYRKTAENRDRELSKVQRHILNTAAPLTVLHDLLENKQSVSHEEILALIEKSLCLLGNASNTVSTLRRSKVLYAINPSKISLAEALYPNAGTLLFGNDINKLAADSADISRNLQKNLASRQPSTQNYSTGASNFQKYQPKNEKFRQSTQGMNRYARGANTGRFRQQGNRQQPFRNNNSASR